MGLQRAGDTHQVYIRPARSGVKGDFFSSLFKCKSLLSAKVIDPIEDKNRQIDRMSDEESEVEFL